MSSIRAMRARVIVVLPTPNALMAYADLIRSAGIDGGDNEPPSEARAAVFSSMPVHSAFPAMLDCTVFLTSDFPAVALVVCSEEEVVAHGFDRLHTQDRRSNRRPQVNVGFRKE
jgi:hypothetical protein